MWARKSPEEEKLARSSRRDRGLGNDAKHILVPDYYHAVPPRRKTFRMRGVGASGQEMRITISMSRVAPALRARQPYLTVDPWSGSVLRLLDVVGENDSVTGFA